MQAGGPNHSDSNLILRKVVEDFEALLRVIDGAIDALAGGDEGEVAREGLRRAKEAAEKGAALVRARLHN